LSATSPAVDRRTIDRLYLCAKHLEHLLQPLHMGLGFIEMRQKALFELLVAGLAGHFRKRLHELLLGVIDVLQLMHEQVVHGLDVFAEQSHGGSFLLWDQRRDPLPRAVVPLSTPR
jgi:hypothetical protein